MDEIEKLLEQFNREHERIELRSRFLRKEERRFILYIKGQLNTHNSPAFTRLIEEFGNLKDLGDSFVLDCKNIDYISSTGIGTFATILVKCRQHGVLFYLSRLPEKVKNVLSVLGFSAYFNFLDNPEDIG